MCTNIYYIHVYTGVQTLRPTLIYTHIRMHAGMQMHICLHIHIQTLAYLTLICMHACMQIHTHTHSLTTMVVISL